MGQSRKTNQQARRPGGCVLWASWWLTERQTPARLVQQQLGTDLESRGATGFLRQVCSYRCIASYESPAFADFSMCILQKHNCLGLDAQIPPRPVVEPMQRFRGQPLTHDVAEDIFVGEACPGRRLL
jgi:VDE lipocalin domain